MSEEAAPPPAATPPAEQPPGEGEEASLPPFKPPCMDLSEFPLKADYFEGMHMAADTEEKIEGAHNFRQVTGFPVFGVGQPNLEGIKIALEKIKGSCDEKNNKELFKQS